MYTLLQLVQDMNNRMIAYERKGNVSYSTPGEYYSSLAPFRNTNESNFHPKAIMARSWCNFCEENHEESTCEVKKNDRDNIFGKSLDTMFVILDWVEPKNVMVINTRNKYYTSKGKYDLPCTSSTPRSSSQSVDTQYAIILDNRGVSSPFPSSKYNILNQLANINS